MKRIHPLLATAAALATAVLAIAAGIGLSASASAASGSALPSCAGTSLLPAVAGGDVSVPTTTDGSGQLNCTLESGDAGAAVAGLQAGLDYCNLHETLAINGDYGPSTEAAVARVQVRYHNTPDGVFGPVTSRSMQWPVAGSNNTECSRIRYHNGPDGVFDGPSTRNGPSIRYHDGPVR